MDRSMKVMFGMMTVAICMLAFTMMGNQSQQAFAGNYVGDRDRIDEPTIVWFGVNRSEAYSSQIYSRLWSDGTLQVRRVYFDPQECGFDIESNCDWIDVPPPAGGDGIACGADINNDSVVDVHDIMVVLDMWDSNTVCEPTYECLDLNNLPSGMGG
ncbi:MAG: hypothetical protein CMJ38_06430 [Phycisphaerae bacterium]|nr:hypothetical protein [Phycisphaerae bacterium]